MVHSIIFQTYFVQAVKSHYVVAMRWLTNFYDFMISYSRILEYTLLKPDCHSWWISKMQSGSQNPLEERYAIKFCFKLAKNATETYGMLQTAFEPSCMNRASVFEWHKKFKDGRESVRNDERCGKSTEVNTQELVGQRVGLGLLYWDFKGVQEKIPSEEASTLQIGSVAFPPGQCTSPQIHLCHRLFDQNSVPQPPYSPDFAPFEIWLFLKLRGSRYETIDEIKKAVTKVIDTLTQEDFHGAFQKLLEQYNKCNKGDSFEGD